MKKKKCQATNNYLNVKKPQTHNAARKNKSNPPPPPTILWPLLYIIFQWIKIRKNIFNTKKTDWMVKFAVALYTVMYNLCHLVAICFDYEHIKYANIVWYGLCFVFILGLQALASAVWGRQCASPGSQKHIHPYRGMQMVWTQLTVLGKEIKWRIHNRHRSMSQKRSICSFGRARGGQVILLQTNQHTEKEKHTIFET